jgi:hypothetical protein
MSRATRVLAATSVAAFGLSIWLYLDNRDLRDELATAKRAAPVEHGDEKLATAPNTDAWAAARRDTAPIGTPRTGTGAAPKLPEQKDESRLERRQRRQQELAAMFGRIDGETDEEYRARIGPMITAGLLVPRARVAEMRKQIEEKASVSADQSKKLDQAFDKVYAEAIDYTNKAIADGVLSPYERNVSGWLEFAGGLGGILNDANGQIGKILSADQMKAINASGFEWGEYLGANAPWEKLNPPPPQR